MRKYRELAIECIEYWSNQGFIVRLTKDGQIYVSRDRLTWNYIGIAIRERSE